MRVEQITSWPQLELLEEQWNALAEGMPLRSWDWLATWWTFYGANANTSSRQNAEPSRRELCVFAVYGQPDDANGDDKLVGIAPWYIERSAVKGRVIRWLGDGEVCTDHTSVICSSENVDAVVKAIASKLVDQIEQWDALELSAVDSGDKPVTALIAHLQAADCSIAESSTDAYWAVELPGSWDEYLAGISKSHRKQLRQLERRVLEGDRVKWHPVQTADDLAIAWEVLVDLHQRRRKTLGEPGCFASKSFHDFHQQVAQRLLPKNQLQISWLELDGTPAAAEYHLAGTQATFAYQGGVDPDRLPEEPGRLSTILCMQQAIAEKRTCFDFLRGDEPYKAHWRATPHATCNFRVVPPRRSARIRGRVLNLAGTLQDWARQAAEITNFVSLS